MARRVRVDPSQAAEKWGRRLSGATEDIRRGVNAVTEAPTAQAAEKAEKMRAGINAAIDSGKWQRGLRRIDLPTWQRMTLEKGLGRIAAGVSGAQPKMREFFAEVLPYISGVQSELESMPDVTLEDSISRMTHYIRRMAEFQRR